MDGLPRPPSLRLVCVRRVTHMLSLELWERHASRCLVRKSIGIYIVIHNQAGPTEGGEKQTFDGLQDNRNLHNRASGILLGLLG